MTTPRLSETDLARLCVYSGAGLDDALRLYKTGGGSWSYDPARSSVPDAVAATPPLAFEMPRVPWQNLKSHVEQKCSRSEAQRKANVEATKVLYEESVKRGWRAVQTPFASMPIGMGESVRYWSNVIVEDSEGLFVFFADHRRDRGLSGVEARRIVYSMQDVWIRSRYPDLGDARLAILRFPMVGKERVMRLHFANQEDLLTYEQLDQRVQTVYEAWGRIHEERTRDRRTGTDG